MVRTHKKHKITIKNLSNTNWKIKTNITGGPDHCYFSGNDILEVSANSATDYEITYSPMRMTSTNMLHNGNIFFPLPDG